MSHLTTLIRIALERHDLPLVLALLIGLLALGIVAFILFKLLP